MLFALSRYAGYMDGYERAILLLTAPTFAALGWHWKPVRWLMPVVALLSLWAISLYGGSLAAAEQKFFLKYMLSSQSAILWMSAMFVFSTVFYWIGLLARSPFGAAIGSRLCWAAVVLGFTGMMVRWYESYLIGADVGHIPVSNLYEVFILFSMITALFYLYYEAALRHAPAGRLRPADHQPPPSASCSGTRSRATRPRSSRWCRRCKAGG